MAERTRSTQTTVNTPLVTTAETVVATLDSITTGRPVNITLKGWAQLTMGVAATAVTPRIRRGVDATGTLIDEGNPITAVAGNTGHFDLTVVDEAADISGATYVFTLQQTAATGNGSCLQAGLTADIPD